MVYLYAGLGVLMISGIMAIFEMGLSLTGQSMIPTPAGVYLQSAEMKLVDQRLLALLKNRSAVAAGLANNSLCTALLASYSNQYPGQSAGSLDNRMPVATGHWIRSCQLNRGSHRILIMPPDPAQPNMPYELFSCALTGGNDQCAFER